MVLKKLAPLSKFESNALEKDMTDGAFIRVSGHLFQWFTFLTEKAACCKCIGGRSMPTRIIAATVKFHEGKRHSLMYYEIHSLIVQLIVWNSLKEMRSGRTALYGDILKAIFYLANVFPSPNA